MTVKNLAPKSIEDLNLEKYDSSVEVVNYIPQDILDHIVHLYEQSDFNELDFLGEGSYGTVYGYGDYAIKKIFDLSGSADVAVLKDIGHLDCIPTLYAIIEDDTIIIERIDGYTVRDYQDYYDDNPYGIGKDVLEEWDNALMSILELGYSPYDMHASNVMISSDATLKIVDTGYFKKHPLSEEEWSEYNSDEGYRTAHRWVGKALKNILGLALAD